MEYFIARGLSTDDPSLESLVHEVWQLFPDPIDRRVGEGGVYAEGSSLTPFPEGRGLHCVRIDTKGVAKRSIKNPEEIKTQIANKGEDFLHGNFMALIRDNHVIAIGAGGNAKDIRIFLEGLFKKAQQKIQNDVYTDVAGRLHFEHVANKDTLDKIKKYGVQSFVINAGPGGDFSDQIRGGLLSGFIGDEDKLYGGAVRDYDGLKMAVTVTRVRGTRVTEVTENNLDKWGERMVGDIGGDYKILLKKGGGSILPGSEIHRKSARLEVVAGGFNSPNDAWEKIRAYYHELKCEHKELGLP